MTDIRIELKLEGQETNANTLSSLQEWIQREQIIGLKRIKKTVSQSKPETMGIDPITGLSILLGSRVVAELIKSIRVWAEIQSKAKTTNNITKITIIYLEEKNIKILEIDAKKPPEVELLIEEMIKNLQTENSAKAKSLMNDLSKEKQLNED